MVYGSSCCSCAARAKYSTASFWNPYDDPGGGISSCWPSYDGHDHAASNTIDELMNVTFCRLPSRCAAIAASHVDAMMRSLVARRSYAYAWK
jgi:hypothetical protein